ncbi:MAG: N-acetylmuramoyl-L-alanine amidase [Alphaproteobacteria bacterium]
MIASRTLLASLALALCLGLSAGAAERVTSEPRVTTSSIVTGGARAGATATASRSTLPAVASAAALSGDEKLTRLVIDLTRAVDLRAFALADPHRVIVDLDETTFHLPATFSAERRGVIQAVRYGLFAPGKSRIVIDLAQPATIERALVAEAEGSTPPRLILELARTDQDGFRRAMAERATSNIARRGDRETVTPRTSRNPVADGPPVVVIDPGHGGIDAGAVAVNGAEEKIMVLDFARVLRDKLNASGRYRVVMTRDRDVFVPLDDRVKFAREARGALFVSVHADSISGAEDGARGVTVYTLSDTASDAESAKLAERENRADAIAGLDLREEPTDVADILLDLTRRETRLMSHNFARTLAGEMRQATRMHRLPLRSAGFRVLRAHDIPSVLVELGFVSSPSDVEMLTSAAWRDRTAETVARAIDAFFALRRSGQPSAARQ